MKRSRNQWIFVTITLIGIFSGSKLLAIYEANAPSPELRKTLTAARQKNENKEIAEKTEMKMVLDSAAVKRKELANNLIQTGLQRIGIPYVYGGTSVKGFDCSGFVHHTFREFDIQVPRSSQLLAGAGKPVAKEKARRGDILIFTGTNSKVRRPGHVGIVISKTGEPLEFVHASSVGGVKVSKVPGTNYERRFLEVRRVL